MSFATTSPVVLAERRTARGLVRALPTTTLAHQGRHAVTWPVDSTREAVTSAARQGGVHGWVEALDLAQRRVDHLVLDGAGATVVQSRWHDTAITQSALTALAVQAADVATATAALVRSRGCTAPVRALVVIWGSAQADVPVGGFATDGVLVLRGADLETYLGWSAQAHDGLGFDAALDLLVALAGERTGDRVVSTVC
jgi:hypothetical protein